MIKIEKTDVYGFEAAVRGMRNPMNSWDKSDSGFAYDCEQCGKLDSYGVCLALEPKCSDYLSYHIGDNDLSLMKKLVKAGTDHSKFMRFVTVTVDVTAPLYWWKEFDTYKVGTVANSCSTMHKIHTKELDIEDFSHDHLKAAGLYIMKDIITEMNICRELFLETNDKKWWWQIIQLMPSSYNQKRTVQLNYAVLINMYHARKNHKLDEWRDFCAWVETLPYSELITE